MTDPFPAAFYAVPPDAERDEKLMNFGRLDQAVLDIVARLREQGYDDTADGIAGNAASLREELRNPSASLIEALTTIADAASGIVAQLHRVTGPDAKPE